MYIDGKSIKISLTIDGICLKIKDNEENVTIINMTKAEATAFIKTLQLVV